MNKFRLYVAALGIALLMACGGGGGGGESTPPPAVAATPASLVAALQSETNQKKLDALPFPFMVRAEADATVPELAQLVALGAPALETILDEFRKAPGVNDDIKLSLLAYALEKLGNKQALPVLATWLDENMLGGVSPWPTDFVTHTIKVLQGQSGLNTATFTYLIHEKFDTLLQAKQVAQAAGARATAASVTARSATAAGGTAGVQGVLNGNLTPQQRNQCPKTIYITGINAAGEEVTLAMGYNTYLRDSNDLAVDASLSAEDRAKAARRVQAWGESDETIHGGSSYQEFANAKATEFSNCGGSVIERVVNQLNPMLGIPINVGRGGSTADEIHKVAKTFGSEVDFKDIDALTVISIGKFGVSRPNGQTGDDIGHVEIPLSVSGNTAVIQSKFNQGKFRLHQVDLTGSIRTAFNPVINKLAESSYFVRFSGVEAKFFKIDPRRIRRIVIDSSRCPCTPGDPTNIPVQISQPTAAETANRVVTIEGGAGNGGTDVLSGATLTVNGVPQNVSITEGRFSTQVVLRSGDNVIRVAVEGVDGRRGCAVKNIVSTTPKTTISATLTWALGDADVDLYVTQPDNQTAWYGSKSTSAGGRLDVDNTRGFGPENYFISLADDSPLKAGTYTVQVHYFRDHQQDTTHPVRPVNWRVVILLNEATPKEKIEVYTGTLAKDNRNNDRPGSSGPDWATARTVTLPAATSP